MTKWITTICVSIILMMSTTSCTTAKKTDSTPQATAPQDRKPKSPVLTRPVVRVLWIPDHISNDRFEEGHFVHVLEKSSVWSEDQ